MRFIQLLSQVILICSFIALGSNASAQALPNLSSKHYCLLDRNSGQIILSHEADEIRQVASTTKMMTAILAKEYCELDEVAQVTRHAEHTPEFSIGLREGQKVTVAEVLKAALIKSSNDAAVVLAEHVAGDERFFGHLMSKKAFLIGAFNTHFVNASGLPDKEHNSTAYDLAIIGRYLLSLEYLNRIVALPAAEFAHPGYNRAITINNTNGLLTSYPGADGIKTGTTDAAGKCLVASATRNNRGLIAVVLRSGDRKGDCARLLDYGFEQTSLQKIIDQGHPFKELKVEGGKPAYIKIYPAEEISLWLGEESPDIEKKVCMDYYLHAPLSSGQKIGYVEIFADGKFVASTALIAGEGSKDSNSFLQRIIQYLKGS